MANKLSPDDAKDRVNQLYTYILERQPDEGGQATYTRMLENGEHSVREIAGFMGQSQEYDERFVTPNSNEEAVRIAYQKFLGRDADEGGLRVNTDIATRQGVKHVIGLLVSSPEYQSNFGEDTPPSKIS